MRAIAIGIVLLTAAPAVFSEEKGNPLTALRLYDHCKDRHGTGSVYCGGVLLGFVNALMAGVRGNVWTWSCTGSDTSLQMGYVAWAEKNAAKLDHDLRDVLSEFLLEAGFCRMVKMSTN